MRTVRRVLVYLAVAVVLLALTVLCALADSVRWTP